MNNVDTDTLVLSNLPLATHFAKRYRGLVNLEDAIQQARIGLVKAAKTFNGEIGKFSTYAGRLIKNELSDMLRTRHLVTIPEYLSRKADSKASVTTQTIEMARLILTTIDYIPTDADITDYLIRQGKAQREIDNAFAARAAANCDTLNAPAGDDARDMIGNVADYRDVTDDSTDHRSTIVELLSSLTDTESKVISMRYGLNDGESLTLQQIGDRLNLTRSRVQQIEMSAMKKMKAVNAA